MSSVSSAQVICSLFHITNNLFPIFLSHLQFSPEERDSSIKVCYALISNVLITCNPVSLLPSLPKFDSLDHRTQLSALLCPKKDRTGQNTNPCPVVSITTHKEVVDVVVKSPDSGPNFPGFKPLLQHSNFGQGY